MKGSSNGTGDGGSPVVKTENFSDGSELVELENGALLLRESKTPRRELFAEQPAPYGKPAPKPKLKPG